MGSYEEDIWDLPGTYHAFKPVDSLEKEALVTKGERVVFPQPSDSPNDPLTWGLPRKYWHASLLLVIVGLTAATSNCASAAQDGLEKELGLSQGTFNTGAGVLFCGIAYWTLLSGPGVYLWGCRIQYIIGTVFGVVGNAWYAKTASASDAIWSQLFIGASESTAEAIVQYSFSQIFYRHQMSPALAWYVLAISVGTFLGPLIGGIASDRHGWPWVGWLGAITSGFVLLLVIFTLEETNFDREDYLKRNEKCPKEDNKNTEPPTLSFQTSEAAERYAEMNSLKSSANSVDLLISPEQEQVPTRPRSSLLVQERSDCEHVSVQGVEQQPHQSEKPYSYWRKMAFITLAPNTRGFGFKQYAKRLWLNLRVFYYPAVIYSGIQWGMQSAWLTFYISLQSDWWSEPPYNYGDIGVALMNVPTLIGSIIGCIYGSYGSDWIVDYLSRRNKGVFEAEFRLWAMMPCIIINPIGMFLLGIGTERQWPWPAPYVGLGLIGFGYGCAGDLSMSYVVDCYPDMVLETFIGVSAINNTLGMIFSFICDPWMRIGPERTFIAVGVLCFFFLALTCPMIIWGKAARKWTRKSYFALIEERSSLS